MNNDQKTLESMGQAVWYNRWTMKKIVLYLKGDILEIGCGIGNFTHHLTKYGNVWAIDIEPKYIEETKVNAKSTKVGLGNIENGKYFFKDEHSYSTNKKFDSIVCINVLEHIKDDKKALINISHLLNKNGYLILLVPTHQFLFNSIDQSLGHFRRYDKKIIKSLLREVNLNIISIKRLNFIGALGWFLAGNLLGNKHISEKKITLFNFFAPIFLSFEFFLEPLIGTSLLVIATKK